MKTHKTKRHHSVKTERRHSGHLSVTSQSSEYQVNFSDHLVNIQCHSVIIPLPFSNIHFDLNIHFWILYKRSLKCACHSVYWMLTEWWLKCDWNPPFSSPFSRHSATIQSPFSRLKGEISSCVKRQFLLRNELNQYTSYGSITWSWIPGTLRFVNCKKVYKKA